MRRALCLSLGLLLAAPGAARGFDFASLYSLLQRQDIGSVEQLLAALPPAQRNRYALMFESRSLQGGGAQNPRVILFGADARFILTFNGSPVQRGFRVVETMEFDDQTREFRLHELQFPERAAGAAKVLVSEVNPEHCARCHGAPARPVWDTFPLWPGAYGEHYRASLSTRERAGLAQFLAQQPTHPRYRYLLDAHRFADPQTFRPSALSQYAGTPQEPPNAELTLYLSKLQSQSITRQLQRQPAFAAYQYALLGLAEDTCGGLADFYPDALWRAQRAAFARFVTDAAAENARQAQLKAARAASTGGAGAAAAAATATLAQLRFVVESALGVGTRDWTLALEKGSYDFTMPPLSAQPLRESLLAEVAQSDTAIQDLSYSSSSSDSDRYCSYLKKRSRAALSPPNNGASSAAVVNPAAPFAAAAVAADPQHAVGDAHGPSAVVAPPAALQLCASCHETGVAPPVPFSDPAQLTQQLRTRSTAHGALIDEIRFRFSAEAGALRMPLGVNLSEADRRSLEAYFTALASSPN